MGLEMTSSLSILEMIRSFVGWPRSSCFLKVGGNVSGIMVQKGERKMVLSLSLYIYI